MDNQVHPNLMEALPPVPEETTQEQPAQEQPQQEVKPQETEQAKNFRTLRERAQQLERERNEAYARMQELEAKNKPQPVAQDEDFSINDSDLAEGKHLKKLHNEIKSLKSELQKNYQASSEMAIEARLKAQYGDFDKVVNSENIAQLQTMHPEIANTLMSSTDLYSKGASAYKLIKQFGIGQADPYQQEKQTAQRNAAKPRPLASLSPQQGESPLAHANAFANGLTEDLKSQLWKETIAAMKQR